DLPDAHPDAGVHVTGVEYGNFEIEPIVGWIAGHLARIEGAAAGTPDITAGAELPCQLAAQNSCGGGAVLQRSGIVIELDVTTAISRAPSSSTAMCTAPVSPHRPSSVQCLADS